MVQHTNQLQPVCYFMSWPPRICERVQQLSQFIDSTLTCTEFVSPVMFCFVQTQERAQSHNMWREHSHNMWRQHSHNIWRQDSHNMWRLSQSQYYRNESWVFPYNPETKCQSMEWKQIMTEAQKFFLQELRIKIMLIIFWYTECDPQKLCACSTNSEQ
jgi:hypothetical protein